MGVVWQKKDCELLVRFVDWTKLDQLILDMISYTLLYDVSQQKKGNLGPN